VKGGFAMRDEPVSCQSQNKEVTLARSKSEWNTYAPKPDLVDYLAELKQAGADAPGELHWETCIALQKERDQLAKGLSWIAEKFGNAGVFDQSQKKIIRDQVEVILDETRQFHHGEKVRRRLKRLQSHPAAT
jgi:hypothetical protein